MIKICVNKLDRNARRRRMMEIEFDNGIKKQKHTHLRPFSVSTRRASSQIAINGDSEGRARHKVRGLWRVWT